MSELEEKATKEDLERRFLQLVNQEKDVQEIGSVVDFVNDVLEFNKTSLHDKGLAFLLNTLDHYQNDPIIHELWKRIEQSVETYEPLLEFIYLHPDYTQLLHFYLNEKLNLMHVEDILNEINKLLVTAPFLVKNRDFQTLVIKKTAHAVGDSTDLFKAAGAVKEFKVTNSDVDFSKIKELMMIYSEIALLDEVDLQNITLTEIDTFALITTGKLNENGLNDNRIINKYKILHVLHELFNTPVVSVGLLLQQLSPTSTVELREVLKNVLRGNISEQYFQHILAAFEDEDGSYHYPQLFAYLSKNADDKLMLSFVKWTAKNLQLDHHYHRALKAYLKSHPRSIWKNKTARKELENISVASFRRLVKEVQNESASPVRKYFKKSGAQLSIVLLIIFGVGSGLYLGYDFLAGKQEKAVASKSSKLETTKSAETQKEGPSLEPFKRWDDANPFVFNVNGEQQKITFAQANPTGGKSIVLTGIQNIETPFDLAIDSEVSPFDEKGVLREDFSLYHAVHDFDGNGAPEVVIMALSETFESFVWVYSPISENGSLNLHADLAINGMSDAKLVNNTLSILGENGQSETYAFVNQQFIKQ